MYRSFSFLFFFPFPLSLPNLRFPDRITSEASFPPQLLIGYLNHSHSNLVFSSLPPIILKTVAEWGGFDDCARCYKTTAATNPASLFRSSGNLCTSHT